MSNLQLEIALQEGMSVKVDGDRILIEIDETKTKRDLWSFQIEMWLSNKKTLKVISSGYMRYIRKKLSFKLWQ